MSLLFAPLAILWVAAVALALLDGRRTVTGWAAVAALAAACAALLVLTLRVSEAGAVDLVAGGWPADVGIGLHADVLGAVFALTSCVVLTAALAHAVLTGSQARTTSALTLFMALGLCGLFLTGDVFSFYVFFELSMIAAFSLAAAEGQPRQLGAAFIFTVVSLLGSFLFLLAVAALYRATGTLAMEEVARRTGELEPNTAIVIAITFFVAFGVKLGLFPFHFWLPAVYVSASPAVAAMLAAGLANIGAYGLLRFGSDLLERQLALGGTALVAIGVVSIVYGSVQAISQRDPREVLAYSSIGNAGYLLVALGLGGPVGLAAAFVFSVANALNKGMLFLATDLRGPLVATTFALGALSVAGVPPTVGFFGKAALFEAGVESASATAVVLLFLGSAISFVYMFQVYQRCHWVGPGPGASSSRSRRTPAIALAAVVLGLGLWPQPLLAVGEQVGATLGGDDPPSTAALSREGMP